MITTLIFDLDGLLADTEKLHRRAYQDVLAECDVAMPGEHYDDVWIRRGLGIDAYIAEQGLPLEADTLRPRKAERDRQLLQGVEPMPWALETLETWHGRKTLALATASRGVDARAALARLNIHRYFACIAAKEDVQRIKPHPDIFLHVATTLRVAPEECIVLEDSEKGVVAAAGAGMRSIAVPNAHTRTNDFSHATVVLDSLRELTPHLLEQIEAA